MRLPRFARNDMVATWSGQVRGFGLVRRDPEGSHYRSKGGDKTRPYGSKLIERVM